jgi:3-oxoacyl-(acyl-carrier-protein) synthase III
MFVPERVVSNDELAPRLGLDAAQIHKSSGIHRRRWVTPGTCTSTIASEALRAALENASLLPPQIEYLICGTMTPDRFIPGVGPSVQKTLSLREIPCLDIRDTCCNCLYGLQVAHALVSGGLVRNVAICLAEAQSQWLDLTPKAGTISMLFGDGAAAIIVSGYRQEGALEIIDVLLGTDGTYVNDLGVRSPGSEFGVLFSEQAAANFAPHMIGQSVILQASRRMVAACQAVLERNHLSAKDIRWLVPHQANANLLAQVSRGLRLSPDKCTTISVLEDLGNTSSASMGIALDTLRRSREIQCGDHLLLPAFGAGFTWGAALCRAT